MKIVFLNSSRHLLLLSLCLLLALAHPARGAVTPVAWYRLGENDPGAASGVAVAITTTDLVGTKHLEQFGSPFYTNVVSTGASNRVGSSLAVQFNGTSQSLSNAVVSTATDNFGIEAWVKPGTVAGAGVSNYFIAYNGNTASNGWGIFQNGSRYFGMLGGVMLFGTGTTAAAGTWAHVALVRTNGTTSLYVNGIFRGSTVSAPIAPAGGFAIGSAPESPTSQYFAGAIDEVRVFTFAAGQFSTNDLLLNGQRVTTLPATGATTASPTLNGSVSPSGLPTSAWFEWGPTTNYGNTTSPQALTGAGSTNFSALLTGLAGVVHFRAVASNSLGIASGTNQSFTIPVFGDIGAGLPGVVDGSAVWGDYDSDGRLDILLTGTNVAFGQIGQVWRNNGSGFTNIYLVGPFVGMGRNVVAWGDYDNDGRLDFLLAPLYIVFGGSQSTLFHNTGSGFEHIFGGPAADGSVSAVAWGDYDNDGRSDFLVTGVNLNDFIENSRLWRNTANGFTNFVVRQTSPPAGGSVAWGDYDNDGWLDLVLTGQGSQPLWRNTGSGFTNLGFGLPAGGVRGAVAWGDYDNDGRSDILITGTTNGVASGAHSRVWRNTASGFTNINTGLPGVDYSSVAWGDYDNDGRLDILITGTTNDVASGAISQVWRNTGAGFSNINAGLPGVYRGSGAWGDYDNDGRLDILLSGSNAAAGAICQVWRNNTPAANTPPNAPTGLTATVTDGMVTLSWNAANDAQTSASGLSYNLRVGTTPGAGDVFSPLSAANGFRRLPQTGNAQTRLFARLKVTVGTPYFWSVQAVDSSFAGSAFAAEADFKLQQWEAPLIVTPAAATSLLVGDYNGNGVIDEGELNTVLANYFPNSPFLQMTNVAGLGGANVTFALTNNLTGAFSVEYTTNLVDWLFLGPATPRYEFTDTNAPAVPQRYYRLRWP